VKPELLEKAAFAIRALVDERDALKEELGAYKQAEDVNYLVRRMGHLAPRNQDPESWVNSLLESGSTVSGLKEAASLFPDADEGFQEDTSSQDFGGESDAMKEVTRLVLGEC